LKGGARYLKKGGGVLRATAAVKYAWRQQPSAAFCVSRVCRRLEVSRSGDDEWLARPSNTQADAEQPWQETGPHDFPQGRGTYGTRRIKPLLAPEGLQGSRRRLGPMLTQAGLRCKTRRKFKAPTTAGQAQMVAPNQRTREFPVTEPATL
jgi:putative transposase